MSAIGRSRQPRGERRRRALLHAALRVIAERGVAATTHRAVADEAGVPLSTTTYYFEGLDELLEEALILFVREEADRLRALAAQLEGKHMPAEELARMFIAELRVSHGVELAQFDLYIEAARRPRMREAARECIDVYVEIAEAALRAAGSPHAKERAPAFVALIDGYGLHRVATGRPDDLERAMLTLFQA